MLQLLPYNTAEGDAENGVRQAHCKNHERSKPTLQITHFKQNFVSRISAVASAAMQLARDALSPMQGSRRVDRSRERGQECDGGQPGHLPGIATE